MALAAAEGLMRFWGGAFATAAAIFMVPDV